MDRATLEEIKTDFLDSYFYYCWHKIETGADWSDREQEYGYAYEKRKDAYDLPVEQLMLEVIMLILKANRWQDYDHVHLDRINRILEEHGWEELSKDLSAEEVDFMGRYFKLLGLQPDHSARPSG
ncbi:hypothetical protein [Aestuariispira insulae]|uniref:Uncharacterized protein n=1 Tax=Aestuariispira insulae TaxID=1461337 RepID=A0A3D9H0P8_9PROT|nr:hypothetical protein [Aestuariispira insulae]RED43084.1 hypothetical protein DFP90_1363 [Aestuariispira insulae]